MRLNKQTQNNFLKKKPLSESVMYDMLSRFIRDGRDAIQEPELAQLLVSHEVLRVHLKQLKKRQKHGSQEKDKQKIKDSYNP